MVFLSTGPIRLTLSYLMASTSCSTLRKCIEALRAGFIGYFRDVNKHQIVTHAPCLQVNKFLFQLLVFWRKGIVFITSFICGKFCVIGNVIGTSNIILNGPKFVFETRYVFLQGCFFLPWSQAYTVYFQHN